MNARRTAHVGRAAAFLALGLAGACTSTTATTPQFEPDGDAPATGASFAASATGTGDLALIGIDGTGGTVTDTAAGTITLPAGTITGGALAGALSGDRSAIALAAGGTVILSDLAGTEYVRFFEATPTGGAPYSGVVGFRTAPGEVPQSGLVSYSGRASVAAADAESLYDLEGNARVEADFASGRVRVAIEDLTGQRTRGGTVSSARVQAVTVSDSLLANGVFRGGRPQVTGAPFTLGAAADASQTEGAFFGQAADEAAGRIVIRDAGESVTIVGRFAAD